MVGPPHDFTGGRVPFCHEMVLHFLKSVSDSGKSRCALYPIEGFQVQIQVGSLEEASTPCDVVGVQNHQSVGPDCKNPHASHPRLQAHAQFAADEVRHLGLVQQVHPDDQPSHPRQVSRCALAD